MIDDPGAHTSPTADQLANWNADRETSVKYQVSLAESEKASEKATKFSNSEEAVRIRKEREAKKAAAARAKALAEGLPVDEELPQYSVPLKVEERPATPSKVAAQAFTVTIPASSSDLLWYTPGTSPYFSLESARQAGVWNYPTTPYERAKCRVFQDLWEKGNFMGGGIKFGGDFLVYPGMWDADLCGIILTQFLSGDPMRYHSHFVATVIESPGAPLTPMEVVAHGRLGTATKKSHLFCEWNEVEQEVTYFSVEWAGFG